MQSKRIIVWHTTADPAHRTSYYRAEAESWQIMEGLARTAKVDPLHIVLVSVSEPVELAEYDITAAAAEYLEQLASKGHRDAGPARYVLAALLGIRAAEVDLWAAEHCDQEPHLVITETPF